MTLYARESVAGRPLPTFTVDASLFEQFIPYMAKSYTIYAKRGDGSPVLLRSVMLNFRPVQPGEARGERPY